VSLLFLTETTCVTLPFSRNFIVGTGACTVAGVSEGVVSAAGGSPIIAR